MTFILCCVICSLAASGQRLDGVIRDNGSGAKVRFTYADGLTTVEDSASVAADGGFVKTFAFKHPEYVTLAYGKLRGRIYVFPGARLSVRCGETVAVAGDDGINNYLDWRCGSFVRQTVSMRYIGVYWRLAIILGSLERETRINSGRGRSARSLLLAIQIRIGYPIHINEAGYLCCASCATPQST